jgi:glutathione synthase/RimK-type ligase-like ATP-grasp enzyme
MLAIHNSGTGFHPRWIDYCERKGIPYRQVNCHASDIIQQVRGCQALMWHHGQSNPRDVLIARPILSALEHAGVKVFPDFRTAWHFDDKVAQKYLFEALNVPAVPAHVFVDRQEALAWVDRADFPKVFKLRRGAGSAGVRLARSRPEARKLVKRAFGRGFPLYDPWSNLRERMYKFRIGQMGLAELLKGLPRFVWPPRYTRILGRERAYVYFQDFVPGNSSDIRVFVSGNKLCALTRLTRPNDFRASGSGLLDYSPEKVDKNVISLAFEITNRVGADALAMDFLIAKSGKPLVIEISYGSPASFYDPCPGYWDSRLNWYPGPFDPQGWMVDLVHQKIADSLA